MHVLRIQHATPDFDAWKQSFDSDPMGREESGVRRYRILRAANDPNYVFIDLEFDTADAAEALHERLKELWTRVDVARNPSARLVEVAETVEY